MKERAEGNGPGWKSWFKAPLGRWSYFRTGFILIILKYNLDRMIAYLGFHRPWTFWNYVEPHRFSTAELSPVNDPLFFSVLLLVSVPFLSLGIVLTVRRLLSAGLSPILCLVFFVPVVNLLFFLVLCLIPQKGDDFSLEKRILDREERWLSSALGSILIVSVLGIGFVVLGVDFFHVYGWGLFVGLPFILGLTSVLIYSRRYHRSLTSCLTLSLIPLLMVGLGLLAIAFEGVICLLMAAPIAVLLGLFGGLIGYVIQDLRHSANGGRMAGLLLAAVPFLMGMESRAEFQTPMMQVTSSVDINAPPEKVWPHVISFSDIPSKREWLFKTGIAYPTHAEILGRGVGAVRHCIFSTGEFIEPIQVWDEPRLLKFTVSAQPEPMSEMSPYREIHPPHLHGYMESRQGQLRLIPLAGGRTRLEGTTWYVNRIWPVGYWTLWTDYIIHHIHLRVLNHIKDLSEQS